MKRVGYSLIGASMSITKETHLTCLWKGCTQL